MDSLYIAGRFKLLYRIPPRRWLLITAGFLLLWTLLMCLLDCRLPPEQRVNPGSLCGARWRGNIAFVLNLVLMLAGLLTIILLTIVRRGSVEHLVVLYPFRVLYGMKAPEDYWKVTVMNLVLYVPFACGVPFCLVRCRCWLRRHSVLTTVLICLLLSVTAELLQYFRGSGLAEVDDVLMNTLGGSIGTIPYVFCGIADCNKSGAEWSRKKDRCPVIYRIFAMNKPTHQK